MGLSIKNLNVAIKGKQILKDVSIEIDNGEFFSLLGSSGSGKSTLLKTIAGLIQEQSGEIIFDGIELHTLPPQKRNLAVVFQDVRLFPNMNVAENITYSMRLKGMPKAERIEKARFYLDLVHLGDFEKRHAAELSGGQAQRVAIARALASDPHFLLLDEPFSALDENLRDDMRGLVAEIHKKTGLTTVMVTHSQNEAFSMSSRIAVMGEGTILQTGTPQQIYLSPATKEVGLYLADGNVLDGVVESGRFAAGTLTVKCNEPDGSYIAIVRDSAITFGEGDFELRVERVGYQGQEMQAVLSDGQIELRHDFRADDCPKAGEMVRVSIDWEKVLFFESNAPGDIPMPE